MNEYPEIPVMLARKADIRQQAQIQSLEGIITAALFRLRQ